MTSTINTTNKPVNGSKVTRKSTPRPRQSAAVKDLQKPATGLTVPPATLEDSAKSTELGQSVQVFANAIAAVEVLAFSGHHELITQLARIAYTRGRQVARENGVDL